MYRAVEARAPSLPTPAAEGVDGRPLSARPGGDVLPGGAAQAAGEALRRRRATPGAQELSAKEREAKERAGAGEADQHAGQLPAEERRGEHARGPDGAGTDGVGPEDAAGPDGAAPDALGPDGVAPDDRDAQVPVEPIRAPEPPKAPRTVDERAKKAEADLDERVDEVEALELVEDPSVESPEDATAKVPDVEAPAPEEPAAAALPDRGGGAATIAAWQGRVEASADGMPPTDMPAPTTYTAPIRQGGGAVSKKWEAKKEKLPEQAKKAFTTKKVPTLEELPPIASPFPVDGAKEKVEAKGVRKLPDQALPALVKSPNGFLPVVGAAPVDTRLPPVAPPVGVPAVGSKSPVAAVNAMAAAVPTPQPTDAGAVVTGTDRAPTYTIDPAHHDTIASVLANIYVEAQTRAEAVVKSAREGAFPGKVLGTRFCFPEIAAPRIVAEKTWLEAELGRVADAAKIGRDTLDQKIEARKVALVEAKTAGVEAVSTSSTTVTTQVNRTAADTKATIASLRSQWDTHFDDVAAQAKGGVDPKVVRAEEQRFAGQLRTYAADHIVAFEGVARERKRKLEVARDGQYEAYQKAALADESDAAQASVPELSEAMTEWVKERRTEVYKAVEALKEGTTTTVETWKSEMRTARDESVAMVQVWADGRIGRERGWLDSLLSRLFDAISAKHEETEAFEAMETEATVGELAQDLQMLEALKTGGYDALDVDEKSRLQRTDAEGAALTGTFFGEGTKGDTAAALTASLGARLSRRRVAPLREAFVSEVMGMTDATRWREVDLLAAAESPGFSAAERADELHKAFDYTWGTDEDRAYDGVKGLTALGGKAVRLAYRARWKEDLDARIASEMSDEDKDRVMFGLDAKQAEADAAALRDACEGAGTDEALINRVLRNKSPEERIAIHAAYRQRYNEDLDGRLKSELDDGFSSIDDWRITEAHLEGKTDKADAIEIKGARNAFWGPDRDKIDAVYTRMHEEVTAEGDKNGKTSAEIDAEIRKRSGKIQDEYKTETKKDLKADLEAAFAPPPPQYQSGPHGQQYQGTYYAARRDLVIGMVDGDRTKVDAAKIQIERTSLYAEDDSISKVLEQQYERAYTRERRDALAQWRTGHDGRSPNDTEMKDLEKVIVEKAKLTSAQSMTALGQRVTTAYGGGNFPDIIADLTQGWGETKALALLEGNGRLEDWQKFEFATRGGGTDEDALKALFKGKSKEEIKALEAEWKRNTTSDLDSFEAVIADETSGRLKQDLLLDNEFGGKPETPEDAIAKSRRKMEYEARTGGVTTDDFGRQHKTEEYQVIEEDLAHLENIQAAYKEALDSDDPAQKHAATLAWQSGVASLDSAVQTNRHMVDQRTEVVAQVVSIVVMVVVMVVLTAVAEFFTAGAATPAVAAMWVAAIGGISALAGGLAAMAVKASIKGDAYGADEWGPDLALALVDAVVSAATAGVGGKILKSAKGAAEVAKTGGKLTGRAAVLAPLGRMAEGGLGSRMTAHFIAEGAEGFAQSLPTALLGTAMNENVLKGNPLLNMLEGAGMGVGLGTVLSGGLGALGGTKVIRPVDAVPPRAATGTHTSLVDASAVDLAAMEAKYLHENPSLGKADFRRDYDALLMKQAEFDPVVRQKLEAQLRDDITDLLPPHHRAAFGDTPVEMWDTRRFEAFTGSGTSDAVVILKDGRPTVIVKQGASPHALAEEGFHLVQSLQGKHAGRLADIDEGRLANWGRLDVREKIPIYRSKLELEIEAQAAMIDALQDRVAAGGRLSERLAVAQQTLLRLKERARQLDRLGPFQRTLMAWGVLPPPRWLDEPARLFSKLARQDKAHLEAAALLDAADVNGVVTTEARKQLADLYKNATTAAGRKGPFVDVLAAVAGMDPKTAVAFLEAAGPVLGRSGAKGDIGKVLKKAAVSADPAAAARLAQHAPFAVVEKLLDRAARTRAGRAEMIGAAERLAAAMGATSFRKKPWDQLVKTFDTDPAKAIELAAIVKRAGLSDVQVVAVVERAGGLSKAKLGELTLAADYVGVLAANPTQHAALIEALTRMKGKDFAGFADAVHNLHGNPQILPDAFANLVRLGADGKLDLHWLGGLVNPHAPGGPRLHGWIVDDLARDANTPWTKLQTRVGKMRGFYGQGVGTLRGLVGEIYAKHLVPDHPILGKDLLELLEQVTDGAAGKRPDLVARYRDGSFRAIEVKTWSKEFWGSALQAYELAAVHGLEKAKAMRPELDFGAIEHMMAQLRNGAHTLEVPGSTKRLAPGLMVTSDWKVAQSFEGLAGTGMARLQKELDGLGVGVHMMGQQQVDAFAQDLVRQFSKAAPIDRSIPLSTRSQRPFFPPKGPKTVTADAGAVGAATPDPSVPAAVVPVTVVPATVVPVVPVPVTHPVVLEGAADFPHESAQATRFAQAEGGGKVRFLGGSSQGIEGYFTPPGSTVEIPISLKDFSATGKLRNILGRINANAAQVKAAGHAGPTVLHVRMSNTTVAELEAFIAGGPIGRMGTEGVFSRLIFEGSDGIVDVTAAGVKRR
ncbi:MAG: hypothetical protein V4850_08595 [Myxococcota bacterium]